MRSALLSSVALVAALSAAHAADMPIVTKAPPAAAVFDWTGWYGGFNYGTGVSQIDGKPELSDGTFDSAGAGFAAGVQAGYNWQFDPRWVAGIEGDIGWLGIDHRRMLFNSGHEFGIKTGWYGTVRARLGHTNGPSLFYVTGGAAFVHERNDWGVPTLGTPIRSESGVTTGWAAGWGTETMLGGNWSAKAEYLYIDAGRSDVFHPDLGGGSSAYFNNRFHVFRQGLNYRFGSGTRPAALPAFNWTGFYVGVNAGAGVSQIHTDDRPVIVAGDTAEVADSGLSGGVQAGYNWQIAPGWIAGVETDAGWLGVDRKPQIWADSFILGAETAWYATLRGRVGYSSGPALLYATGGAAVVHVKNNFDTVGVSADLKSKTAGGWTIGGGIEAALRDGWTAKTEYLYIDAGNQDVQNSFNGIIATFKNRFHVFRFGLNRQFATR